MTRTRNIPLAVGTAMMLVVLFIAVFGPLVAPRDPTEFNYVMEAGRRFVRPPFPAFVNAEFPLGSDTAGRDTLSQLLWAVRPTLLLVLIVVGARLLLGTALGLVSGWGKGRAARVIDALMAWSLAIPVFIVALAAMAAFQVKLGVFAFVIGLAITGWAETARIAREQTQLVKGQPYIEAAQALGMNDGQILRRHVWRQLLPTLTLTAAFEAAGVLLTLASLGFLGYYVGGSNWIMVSDFGARRISGLPELGQMLATASQQRNDFTAMLIAGAAVAFIVAAFTLIGEGLRLRMVNESRRRNALNTAITGFIEAQHVEQRMADALSQRRNRVQLALGALAVVAVVAGVWIWNATRPPLVSPVVNVSGGHLWSGDRRDPAGTLRAAENFDDSAAPAVAWAFDAGDDLSGGPAISKDGTIYVAAKNKQLFALNAEGKALWQVRLDEAPVGSPALGLNGDVFVADEKGGLTSVSPQGRINWTLKNDAGQPAIAGPVVDKAGNIYHPLDGAIISATPEGQLRWRGSSLYTYFSPALKLNQDSGDVFFKDIVLSAADGGEVLGESPDALDQFIAGDDGRMYLQSEKSLLEWRVTPEGIALAEVAKWDYTKNFPGVQVADGSVRADGSAWLLLGNSFLPGRLVWFRPGGELAGSVNFPMRGARVVAIGQRGTIYVCGEGQGATCAAFAFGADQPLWQLDLPARREVVGGALANGRLYVATAQGKLFALAPAFASNASAR
jgi:ABC-type dipeptide/oligopeptide/nickel transport system permease subunit/outer membrane protein assembly factor BamB